jgi:hypothetical protein
VTTLCIECKEQSEKEEAAIAQAGRGGFADEEAGEELSSEGGERITGVGAIED